MSDVPPNRPCVVLLASNQPADAAPVLRLLQPVLPQLQLTHLMSQRQLAEDLPAYGVEAALIEVDLDWADSLAVMQTIQTRFPDCPIVMIATTGQEAVIQTAIELGLAGYVPRVSGQMVGLPEMIQLAMARSGERQIIEEACRQYRRLFDSVPVGLYRTSPAGQILEANLTFVRMLGYPDRAALFAVNILELYVNPLDRKRWQSSLTQKTDLHFFETQFYRRDGTTIWVENSVGLVNDQPESIPYYEGILKDITKRKQAEFALRESEERFRTIVEQSPISIQIVTPDGWTIRVNKAWEELWGVTAADMRSYNILHDRQVISLGMMPYVERGFAGETVLLPPVAYHTPESLKTGRRRWFQARIYPIMGEADKIRHVIIMYEDITDRQWATEDLQRLSIELMNAQETERRHVSQELHDELGQALTAMRINLDMLAQELPADFSPAGRKRLTEVSLLVDETLEHARELSHTLRPTMLDEMGLVPTLRWYVNRYAERLAINIDFEVKDLEERPAAEIETTLYRAVQEALTNIARHAEASRVRLHLIRREARLSVLIEDDGQGFDGEKSMTAGIDRAGMGLFGMRERVARCGGTFNLHSQPGQGTRLMIELPFAPYVNGEK